MKPVIDCEHKNRKIAFIDGLNRIQCTICSELLCVACNGSKWTATFIGRKAIPETKKPCNKCGGSGKEEMESK